jgi:hypothetical protein
LNDAIGRLRDTLGAKINANMFWMGNSKGKYHLEDLGIDRKMLYKYILISWEGQD